MLHISVPIIFLERSIYSVSEGAGSVAVTVLSNGEHLTPVRFIIETTVNSAIGKTNTKWLHYFLCTKSYILQMGWTTIFR